MYFDVILSWKKCFAVACVFVLGGRNCLACDEDCRIVDVEDTEGTLRYVGEHEGSYGAFWIKLGQGFSKLVFQLKIDVQFDFQDDIIYDRLLNITKEQLIAAIPEETQNEWHKIEVKVLKKQVRFAPDPYILKAHVGTNHFEMITSLWWRFNDIKEVQVLIEGDAQVSFECHPCDPEPLLDEAFGIPVPPETPWNHTTPHFLKTSHIVEHLHDSNPLLIILLAVNVILFVLIITFIVSLRIVKNSKGKSFLADQSNPNFPYLHGHYVREENLYDELKDPVVKVLNCSPQDRFTAPPLPKSQPPTAKQVQQLQLPDDLTTNETQGCPSPSADRPTSYSNPSYNPGSSNRAALPAGEKAESASPAKLEVPQETGSETGSENLPSGRLSFQSGCYDPPSSSHQDENSSYV